MSVGREFILTPRDPGESFEQWVTRSLEELSRVSTEEGVLSPLNIDPDSLANEDVLQFDATNQFWTAAQITIPASLPPPDGDKGDITVSSSGTVWTVDSDAITYDKMQDATQECVIGASAAGTLAEITIGTGLEISGGALNVTASGSKIIKNWGPTDASFPPSNYATLDTRNTHPVLDFSTTTPEAAYFRGVMPDNYNGEGITVEIWWTVTSVTSGTVGWDVSLELMDGLDVDSDSFATAQTVTAVTVSATNGTLQSSSVNIADGSAMDSLAAGDMFRIRIRRDTATDTAGDDAELHMVEMRIQ